MGSYATLRLGSLDLGVTKNELDPGLMWLFRPSDKYVERIDARNRQRLAEYVEEEAIEYYDENHPFTIVGPSRFRGIEGVAVVGVGSY